MKIGETRILLGLCAVLSCARPACAETEPARLDLAMIVLDSSTVPSTPDGSSPAWNAIRAVRRFVDGKAVFWKTTADRYSYLYWTPDQGKENKVAPGSASWRTDGRSCGLMSATNCADRTDGSGRAMPLTAYT